nr:efflux RND transporter periplasmic adaptor subunit [uncultured Rhodopila sp.]
MFTAVRLAACLLVLIAATANADQPPRPVRVQTVSYGQQQDAVTYAGTVQARVQASLGFRVAGKVTERDVDIGNHVAAGQILAKLDPADLRLAVEADIQSVRAAEAEAVDARAEFQRYQRLGRGSPAFIASEYDKRRAALGGAEARLAQAQRQLAVARDQLDYTELRADADGVITDLKLEPGQVVAAGQTVINLAHTAETEIVVDVPENRLPDIRAADAVSIRLWSRPDHDFPGRVREIGALADAVSRTFAVKVTVLDAIDETPGLGMTAAVRFARSAGQVVALLPAAAVVSLDGVPSVWVLDPAAHRAVAHPVQVSAWRGDGQVAISGGVPGGAQVVTAGAALLDPAMPVSAWAGAVR